MVDQTLDALLEAVRDHLSVTKAIVVAVSQGYPNREVNEVLDKQTSKLDALIAQRKGKD